MASHKQHKITDEVYFCTITCYKWLPLFQLSGAYQSVYKWFEYLGKMNCKLVGYVIMPNHIHVLLYPTQQEPSLNQLVANGKRFMAYSIISGLKEKKEKGTLKILELGVPFNERKKGKKHMVFIPSFDARVCFDEQMVFQKLDYIHHNPVAGKWNMVEDYSYYSHSSAGFYERGDISSCQITPLNCL